MDVKVSRDSNFNLFEIEVTGGTNNEKIITIKCNSAINCVICGQKVVGYPGSVISFSV